VTRAGCAVQHPSRSSGTFTVRPQRLVITARCPGDDYRADPAAQKLTFWRTPAGDPSPATAYCDGDRRGAPERHRGAVHLFPQFQFGLSYRGLHGIGPGSRHRPGEVFTTDPELPLPRSATITITVSSPVAVFDDFAVFHASDNDGNDLRIWNNSGIMTGT